MVALVRWSGRQGYRFGRLVGFCGRRFGMLVWSPKLSLWSVGRSIRAVRAARESDHRDYRLGQSVALSRLSPRFVGLVAKAIVLAVGRFNETIASVLGPSRQDYGRGQTVVRA